MQGLDDKELSAYLKSDGEPAEVKEVCKYTERCEEN